MKVLRWIAVLPAALIGSVLFYVVARFISKLFDPLDGYGLMQLIYEFIYSALMGGMFVVIGTFVAPDYKKVTAIVLATLGVVLCSISLCLQLFYIKELDWQVIISGVALIIGCIGGATQVYKDKDIF